MNLKEDGLSRIIAGALCALNLTEANQALADQYLEPEEADPALLLKAEYQDFSKLSGLAREACLTWCKELREWAGAEELLARYVRFAAAVGGSSACHVLVNRRDLSWLSGRLTKEQTAAFRAELYACGTDTLQQGCLSALYSMGNKNPEVLLGAMELCRGRDDASKMLLSGTYLYCVSLKGGHAEPAEGTASDLLQRLLGRLPELFGGKVFSDPELLRLQDFVCNSSGDEPVGTDLRMLLRGKQCSEYLFALLSGCAYLALDHGIFFKNFLRLMAAVDMETGRNRLLPVCRYMADRDWFFGHIDFLLHRLSLPPALWINWSFQTREECVWQLMVKEHPNAVKEAAEGLELWYYEQFLERVQRLNPALAKEMFCLERYRQKAAEELTTNFKSEKETARRYFLEVISIEEILPFVKGWRKDSSGYYGNKMTRLERLRQIPELKKMYQRAVVMEGLLARGTWFTNYMFIPDGERNRARVLFVKELDFLFDLLNQEQTPVFWQLDMLSCIHKSLYEPERQEAFVAECVKALDARIGSWGEDYRKAAEKASAVARICCIRTMDLHSEEYKDSLLACASDSSKQVRQVLLDLYCSHRAWEEEIKSMLGAKKQKARQMAVEVLKEWGMNAYQTELKQLLEKEKSGTFAEYLKKLLNAREQEADLDRFAAELLKGNRRQKVLWAFAEPFPPVHTEDGKKISEEYLQAILSCYVSGTPEPAKKLTEPLHKAELSACMVELFHRWMADGAEAKKKWGLYAASNHGGEAIVPLLYQQIQELPGRSRGAMAVEAVHALAQNGSSSALLLVDQISRKFRYRQVQKAAAEALTYAARTLGISREELEDRIVPDLGFDERMKRRFNYGPRQFTVRLTPALELEVCGEAGKRMKNLPSPGKQDDQEKAAAARLAFQQMKKQLKTVTAGQKLRLEQALAVGRFWSPEGWTSLFVKNPVMHSFAIGLIWGVYESGTLEQTFRYMEDGSFNTVEEEPYTLPEKKQIGLVHPVELSEEEREAWKEQLLDYEITQPFEQLSRPVYECGLEEAAETEMARFQGWKLNGLSLAGKLTSFGWNKGPVGDGGAYRTFYREDPEAFVELTFSGCGIAYENMEVEIYEAVFYEPGKKPGPGGKAEKLFLGELSSRYFSEIVLQLTRASASASKE